MAKVIVEMSAHRLIDDAYTYMSRTWQSVRPLQFTTNPIAYHNCTQCRNELGLVSGNNVSIIKGNMVDLESDLRGITRPLSRCPTHKYIPNKYGENRILIESKACGAPRWIDTQLMHLSPCNIHTYQSICMPEPIRKPVCDRPDVYRRIALAG